MSICSTFERNHQDGRRLARLKYRSFSMPAIRAHDVEHEWRSRGEQAIRDEMERRVIVYLQRKVKH